MHINLYVHTIELNWRHHVQGDYAHPRGLRLSAEESQCQGRDASPGGVLETPKSIYANSVALVCTPEFDGKIPVESSTYIIQSGTPV